MSHKTALITGSAKRIGKAIAEYLHAENFNIIIHYRSSEQSAKSLADKLNTIRKNSAQTIQADLENCDYKNLISQAHNFYNRLDVLINNASEFSQTQLGKATEQEWDRLFASNCKAPFFLSQAAIKYLKQQNNSCIINIADIHGTKPIKNHAIYCMAKAGLVMQTQVLAKELGENNIRVNAIAPGMMLLPEGENSIEPEEIEKLTQRSALKKMGCAQDIAQAAYYLTQAYYTTGHVIVVDGGRLLRN